MSATRRVGLLFSLTVLSAAAMVLQVGESRAATYYVRQTVGNDTNDGLSPATAWAHISKLGNIMAEGDTAYVGPGLYRDQIVVHNSGTAEKRIIFIADTTGVHTGDPPGTVMITGAEPVDESIFTPDSAPGVYKAGFTEYPVLGVVEMDGPQYRYTQAESTKEHLTDKLSALDVVARLPSTYFHDRDAGMLYIHTSDGNQPTTHEIEIMRRRHGVDMTDKHHVTIAGFTFRHMRVAGINFFRGSSNGVAIGNVAYGSWQGIRVYGATSVVAYGNTLFRNGNCGIYFAAAATNGLAMGNTSYENIKGVRWSSESANGMALDNILFDNHESGVAIESTSGIVVRGNRVVNNSRSQLMVRKGEYSSDDNCFKKGAPDQLIADFVLTEHFQTLGAYQVAKRQDLRSREGGCGPLPAKMDVQRLHADALGYAERARKALSERPQQGHLEPVP